MSLAEDMVDDQARWLAQRQGKLREQQQLIVARALASLTEELKRVNPGSWTEASRRNTMAMILDLVNRLRGSQTVALRRALALVSQRAWRNTARWITELDKLYAGAARPLAWDSLGHWQAGWGPYDRTRLRVYRRSMRRYGAAAVADIEVAVGQRVLLGRSWVEARDEVMSIVRDKVGDRQWMVDRILRTESAAAYNSTALQAMHAENEEIPDDPLSKKLVATWDARTARDSKLLHGQMRPLGAKFLDPLTQREYMTPPNRPNDREQVIGWRESWPDSDEFDRDTRRPG